MSSGSASGRKLLTAADLQRLCEENPLGPEGRRIRGTLDLRGVELHHRFAKGEVDLRDVDLTEASLAKSRFERVLFCGSDLTRAELGGTTFHLCDFSGAILRDARGQANFEQPSLEGAIVAGLDLTSASGTWTPIESIDWHLALYAPAWVHELNLPDAHNQMVPNRRFAAYNFAGRNLSGFDFRGAVLKAARFDGADLSAADFTDADLRDANLESADLTVASITVEQVLSARNWIRAGLGSDELRKSLKLPLDHDARRADGNFRGCCFTGFDFRNQLLAGLNFEKATLRNADLSGQDLTGTRLDGADLSGASLRGAKLKAAEGLVAGQLRGTDVTQAELPDKIGEFKGTEQVAKLAPAAAKQFLTMLAACLYCWLTVAGTTDVALILGSATLPLPVVQTPIRIVGFYWFGPLVLATVFLYFQVTLHQMWGALAKLPAYFPDGRRLDERVYPWLLIQKVRGRYARLRDEYTIAPRLENYFGSILAYAATPLTVLAFLYRALVKHDAWLTGLHVGVWTLTVLIGLLCHRSAVDTLEGAPVLRGWSNARHSLRIAVACLIAATALWLYASRQLYYKPADLQNADLSTRPDDWTEGQSDISGVKGAKLQQAHLEHASMFGAFLVKADLTGAHLENADLSQADLRGAILAGANLASAETHSTNLEGADFENARFDQVGIPNAWNWALAHYSDDGLKLLGLPANHEDNLNRRDFREYKTPGFPGFFGADLSGANFENLDLRNAIFSKADLRNANLGHCNLTNASFVGAKLGKADLRGADLSHARGLNEPQLREAVLDGSTRLPAAFQALVPPAGENADVAH